ncbi:MAG TPA: hypothetical protein VLX28_19475 [Thermoanaerobaculia bacterium]|nr:hypothetical protein [Thermoanaerobaculia bacterium]
MSELEKESHEEEPKAPDPPTTRNWPVWLVYAVVASLVLAAAAAWLPYLHKRQTQKVSLDYQRSFLAFKEETQEFFNNALASFVKAQSTAPDPGIKPDESAIDSEIYQRGESESKECPVHLDKGRLVYELSGFSENDKNGWDNRWRRWSADPFDRLRGYSASKPLLLLITDKSGEILLTAGRSAIFPPNRQLAAWITQSKDPKKTDPRKRKKLKWTARST